MSPDTRHLRPLRGRSVHALSLSQLVLSPAFGPPAPLWFPVSSLRSAHRDLIRLQCQGMINPACCSVHHGRYTLMLSVCLREGVTTSRRDRLWSGSFHCGHCPVASRLW